MTDLADVTGSSLVGAEDVTGTAGGTFQAYDPATGAALEPAFGECGPDEVVSATTLAWAAFGDYRRTTPEQRAAFLESIADEIEARASLLAERVIAETGLPAGRVAGETARTTGQLRMFAATLREGSWLQARIDPGDPSRSPLPKPDVRQRSVPLGPVAVFGASNFPLAFSVAGGDTASALAAGAPVVVKAHPSHPGTSEIVGRAIRAAVQKHDLPEGTFSLLQGTSNELGGALVADPRIRAVGFTGSRAGGLALVEIARRRAVPIPVYAEMSAVNPVFVLPGALADRAAAIGSAFVTSVTGSAGQLCTKPGLLFVIDGDGADALVDAAKAAVADVASVPMLSAGIAGAFEAATARTAGSDGVRPIGSGTADASIACTGTPTLYDVSGADFLAQPQLQQEMFGPASLVVRVADAGELVAITDTLEGQLTATVHADESDHGTARELFEHLELIAGRLILNGWPTGVEVGHAMVHGGPYPATSAPSTTSVGMRAIERFLRPVAYQDLPDDLLPTELRDDNVQHIFRRIDGRPE
ncbi:aldehyde dehydrogenase (NADP(+)) [Mumia zhuanghuii]|uniref:2,5-dioxovalerate dehydrogenase n=1 Tax=Mumia zhuanghuii TaxID=2585211 RepID=A0A5Q6RJX8_9ACTN|nr:MULTISPECIES: aldehyde dehydrogenase (NADP(+)) [Mumia]KAA1418270.1 aldehyde dehydrogenase (NADP(+)) [Mumia zhuanghuii]